MFIDNASERLVQQALNQAKLGRTTIVIAHRLSTVRNADIIITMKHHEGIVEIGTHDQLMRNKSHYFELVKAQELDSHIEVSDEHNTSEQNESTDNKCKGSTLSEENFRKLKLFCSCM